MQSFGEYLEFPLQDGDSSEADFEEWDRKVAMLRLW